MLSSGYELPEISHGVILEVTSIETGVGRVWVYPFRFTTYLVFFFYDRSTVSLSFMFKTNVYDYV